MYLKIRKLMTTFLVAGFAVIIFPTNVFAAYSAGDAVSFAKSHCAADHTVGKADCPSGWLCAEFVSNCLQAGGLGNTNQALVSSLYSELQKYGTSYELVYNTTNGLISSKDNEGKISEGDVVITYCKAHKLYLHAVLVSSIDESGYACNYAHNNNRFDTRLYTSKWCKGLGGNEDYANITAYVIHFADGTKVGEDKTITGSSTEKSTVSTEAVTVTKPAKTSIKSVTGKKKSIVVKWKAGADDITGYQIKYTNTKSGKSGKVTISDKSTVSTTISNRAAKREYTVRIRTYKTVNGVNYYSSWSAAKSVTTK